MIEINPNEIVKREITNDKSGFTFTWRGKFLRAINPGYEEKIKNLFASGLIDELVSKKMFPKSEISNYKLADSSIVIEHEFFQSVTSPREWSFLMFKDAATTVLKVNLIAKKYGYRTIDAHGYNIIFDKTNPVFVDLGSFVPMGNKFNNKHHGWPAYEEYMKFFYYPLKMWSKGNSNLARKAFIGEFMPSHEYYLYKYPAFRWIPLSILRKFLFVYYSYKMVNVLPDEMISEYMKLTEFRKRMAKLIFWLKGKNLLFFSSVNLNRLIAKTQNISRKKYSTQWGAYYSTDQVSERFKRIKEIIKEFNISEVIDLAGNDGFFPKLLQQLPTINRVICADYDENAIDRLYFTAKTESLAIVPVLMNFMKKPCNSKLKSEAVLALALTHHLLLTQGYHIDSVFERIGYFVKKYVFIEFMPLGLYSKGVAPAVPDWYTTSWFRSKFTEWFDLLIEENLSKNRILFVGKIKE